MDSLRPSWYTPMSRRRCVHEDMLKVLYEGPDPATLIQHFKDDRSFTDGVLDTDETCGVLVNRVSEYVFTRLNAVSIPTHFVRRLNMREQLVRRVEVIPLEVVIWNMAYGSMAAFFGVEEGTQLPRPIIEFYYNPTGVDRRVVTEEHIAAFGLANSQDIEEMMLLAVRMNDFLSGLFFGVGVRLADFKVEFGRIWDEETMKILVANELSPKSCSLWEITRSFGQPDLGLHQAIPGEAEMLSTYLESACKLGIVSKKSAVISVS